MSEIEFWHHMQETGGMTLGWWYTVGAIPAFISAAAVFLLMLFAVHRIPTYATKCIWLMLATLPGMLAFPAFSTAASPRSSLAQLGFALPDTPQAMAYPTALRLASLLNSIALWAIVGAALAIPIMWGGLLAGHIPLASPIARGATRTVTNIATRSFSGHGPKASGQLAARYGTLTVTSGQKQGAIETARPDISIGSRGDIQINDPGISRTHAGLQLQGHAIALLDMGSTNGTYLTRDAQVLPLSGDPVVLQHGDLVSLGDPDLPMSVELLYQRPAEG